VNAASASDVLHEPQEEKRTVKLDEMVALIRKEYPALLGKMPDKRAARIIRAAFGQVAREVGAAREGVVSAPGLGRFRVKEVERTKEGQKAKTKHVVFRVAVIKARPKSKPKAKAR
jgi:hypothetical protein